MKIELKFIRENSYELWKTERGKIEITTTKDVTNRACERLQRHSNRGFDRHFHRNGTAFMASFPDIKRNRDQIDYTPYECDLYSTAVHADSRLRDLFLPRLPSAVSLMS